MRKVDNSSSFGTYKHNWFHWFFWYFCQSRILLKRVRKLLLHYFSPYVLGPFDCEFSNYRFRLYPGENHSDRYIFRRRRLPESQEHDALRPFIFPRMIFVDIGANIGFYSIFISRLLHGEFRLLAFEPHPRTYEKLLYNLSLNDAPHSHILNCALGEKPTKMDLWSDATGNVGASSLIGATDSVKKGSVKNEVSVFPLLDMCRQEGFDKIDLLKIDIEGFEDRVLSPFFSSAPNALLPKAILMETTHSTFWHTDLFSLFTAHGYKRVFANAENIILSR